MIHDLFRHITTAINEVDYCYQRGGHTAVDELLSKAINGNETIETILALLIATNDMSIYLRNRRDLYKYARERLEQEFDETTAAAILGTIE